MSKKIPTLGKGWLFLIAAFAIMGFIGNVINLKDNVIIYILSAIACLVVFISIIFMLMGKGKTYYIIYSIAYIATSLLSINYDKFPKTSWIIGFVLGIIINLWLTHKAIEKTLIKEQKKH